MAEIYGHRWTSAYGENPETGAGGTWAKGLAGMSPAQLARGLSASITNADPWPPTLPQFRARCVGIPTIAALRAEYRYAAGLRDLRDGLVSPFARLVHRFLEHGRYREGNIKAAERALRDAYELASDHLLRGGDLPEPVAAITHTLEKPRELTEEEILERREKSRAAAEKFFSEMRKEYGHAPVDDEGVLQ